MMKTNQKMIPNNQWKLVCIFVVIFLITACSTTAKKSTTKTTVKPQQTITFAKNEEFVILITKMGDTLESLAKKYLGTEKKAWIIADFNDVEYLLPQREIVIPLTATNISGVTPNGYQTIPILCYHRFGNTHTKLSVSEESFEKQMQYLKENDFQVLTMMQVLEFLDGQQPIPKKSVAITIDDGYRSTYEVAFPILKKYNFPATLFLYTDFTGAGDAITWKQAKEMTQSGLMDIQPHSKTHPNMAIRNETESDIDYKNRIVLEIDNPSSKIKNILNIPLHTFAYPYGDTNNTVIKHLEINNYKLGVTVQPGGNPAFAHPFMLYRTMIFGEHDLNDFKQSLVIFNGMNLK